jgi:hypothetical protein
MSARQVRPHPFIAAAAAAVIVAGLIRYIQMPSFWFDEAAVALALRNPSAESIFGPLPYSQYFPRVYLYLVALFRKAAGYELWSLRLLPFLSFVSGTLLWATLVARRSRTTLVAILAGSMLLGANFWLDQAVQLKQYTLDVSLALIPFVIGDSFLDDALMHSRQRVRLVCLGLLCLFSYTYIAALAARILGWYVDDGKRRGRPVLSFSLLILTASAAVGLGVLWLVDIRFNIIASKSYFAYWSDCNLRAGIAAGVPEIMRLLSKFLWGWHGRMPLVTAGMVPLQAIGAYWVIRRCKRPDGPATQGWGSRSLGSLILCLFLVFASAIVSYPICAGRTVLFAQVHLQLLAIEGAIFVSMVWSRRKVGLAALSVFVGVALFHFGREYVRFLRAEPAENLQPALSLLQREGADTLWVHPCSVVQVNALPHGVPVSEVLLGTEIVSPPSGECWVLWTHLGNDDCRRELERVRSLAVTWQVVQQGPGRGLAIAEF